MRVEWIVALLRRCALLGLLLWLAPQLAPSEAALTCLGEPQSPVSVIAPADDAGANLAKWVAILAGMSVLPLLLTMITPFAKIVVVGSMLRQALGTPQVPPTTVITGLALILTLHVTAPLGREIYDRYEGEFARATHEYEDAKRANPLDPIAAPNSITVFATSAHGPLVDFLRRHSDPKNIELFADLRSRMQAAQEGKAAGPATPAASQDATRRAVDDLIEVATLYAPAFMLTELSEAFLIAFLLFVPFLVIDLIVSNVLLAMGMHMLSPTTVSLPLKILVFVLVGGWELFLSGIISGYA